MGTHLASYPATPLLDAYCERMVAWRTSRAFGAERDAIKAQCTDLRARSSGDEEICIVRANRIFGRDAARTDHAEVARQAREAVFA